MVLLSEGALSKMKNGVRVVEPVLQYIDRIQYGNVERIVLSDGEEVYKNCMLSPSINHYIRDRILVEYSVIKIKRMSTSIMENQTQPTRVIYIMSLEVLVHGSLLLQPLGSLAAQVDIRNDEVEQQLNRTSDSFEAIRGRPDAFSDESFDVRDIPSYRNVTPIADLKAYDTGCILKVRVNYKSKIRSYYNDNGQGHYFEMVLVDGSGEIGCVAFNEDCDTFFYQIQVGRIYYIRKPTLKRANKKFAVLNNDYEITLKRYTEIKECPRKDGDVPHRMKFNFTSIKDIEQEQKGTVVDVLGIVKTVGDVVRGVIKNDIRPYTRREVSLVDQSGSMINLTLWNSQAEQLEAKIHSVLVAKCVRVHQYNESKSLSSANQSIILVDPDIPQADTIRNWYDTSGNDSSFTMIRVDDSSKPWLTIAQAKNLGYGKEPSFYTVKATVYRFKDDNCLYKACPAETNCGKKMIEQPNGMYWCDKCHREYPNFQWRIVAFVNLSDWSGDVWATAFNKAGEFLLGTTAFELSRLKETDISQYLDKLHEAKMKSLVFRLRMRRETLNGQSKLNTVIDKIMPVDPRTYGVKMLNKIRQNVAS